MASPIRVATYSRVSTSHHDQKPEIQVNELRRYCAARGWEIVHEIIDHGYSGASDQRPGLKKLLTFVRERQVDAVVVLKMDRLFRSLKHLVMSLDEFQFLGVTFVAVKDAIDYSTPSGRLFTQLLGSLAEFEKALLRERTILGLEHARSQGICLGRPRKKVDHSLLLDLRKRGHTFREIENLLGVSRTSLNRITKGYIS